MGYYIDLEKITLDTYVEKLKSGYLPPSRVILKDDLEKRFGYFKSIGIENIKQLTQTLRNKAKLRELSKADCFNLDYLKILLRELNSILPKPNRFVDFKHIPPETIDKLHKVGIKTTKDLYSKVLTKRDRQHFADNSAIDITIIEELTKLTDLSRIKWVGFTFARMLYVLHVDTVEKSAQSNPIELHQRISQLNKEDKIYRANIGLNDIRIFVNAAKDLPIEIEY